MNYKLIIFVRCRLSASPV